MSPPFLVLASASPRRFWLMGLLELDFEVSAPHIDESSRPGEAPAEHVARLAVEKAERVRSLKPGRVILAADTAVVLGGRIYGKPRDRDEARGMLEELSGRTHEVLTGWAVAVPDGRVLRGVETSRVSIRKLAPPEIEAYLDKGEHADKAGAYAAQGEGRELIEAIEGSYTNVVGLPLPAVIGALREAGLRPRDPALD